MSLSELADAATLAGGASAVVVAVFASVAFFQYRNAVRTQRAQWLLDLFERFFETGRYRDVRRSMYNVDDEQKWADFLNFFGGVSGRGKASEPG